MRKAFTILELLVATMLLAMLVTILTMIFNQSSVAWTIGVASLTGMNDIRRKDAIYAAEAEDALRRDSSGGNPVRLVSVWDDSGTGLRTGGRTVVSATDGTDGFKLLTLTAQDMEDTLPDKNFMLGSGTSQSRASYIVGVTSWGPDGEKGTWDDITTMPEEVVK